MLSCKDYKLLDESLQEKLLWLDGIFLMARKTEKIKAELFSLYGFYVEAFFADEDEIIFVKAFEDVSGLDLYLGMINIDSVLENSK
jgi:hypothetical protein